MARLRFTAHTNGEVASAAVTVNKTILQILAPANQIVAVRGYAISLDGIAGNAEPVVVEVLRQTSAGTGMTAGTAANDGAGSETVQTTVTKAASAEPTAGTILRQDNIHPQTGAEWRYAPFDEEILVPGGGRLGLRFTVPTGGAAVNALGRFYCEE